MIELVNVTKRYGPKVAVADDAGGVARLMAFIGRDPDWAPPG